MIPKTAIKVENNQTQYCHLLEDKVIMPTPTLFLYFAVLQLYFCVLNRWQISNKVLDWNHQYPFLFSKNTVYMEQNK